MGESISYFVDILSINSRRIYDVTLRGYVPWRKTVSTLI